MSNPASIAGFTGSGTVRNTWPTQTVATVTETILQINTDGSAVGAYITVPTGGQYLGAQTNLNVNANASITGRSGRHYGLAAGVSNDQFSSESWSGRPFFVRVSGIGNAGANAAQSIQVNLYQGSSATVASNKKVGTTGTGLAAVAGGAFNFYVEAEMLWDPTSQILSGSYTANIAFGTTSQFTTTTVSPSVVASVTAANLVFNATLVLGNGASSTITVKEFVIDQI
jgi:hypothetical protein